MALIVEENVYHGPHNNGEVSIHELDQNREVDSPRFYCGTKTESARFKCLGIITLEDVLEELIGEVVN